MNFKDDLALKRHLKIHTDEQLNMLGLRRVDLDFVRYDKDDKKARLNPRSEIDEDNVLEEEQVEKLQMNDVSSEMWMVSKAALRNTTTSALKLVKR